MESAKSLGTGDIVRIAVGVLITAFGVFGLFAMLQDTEIAFFLRLTPLLFIAGGIGLIILTLQNREKI
jgi:hypothetical protein